jgi:hypothetical protein
MNLVIKSPGDSEAQDFSSAYIIRTAMSAGRQLAKCRRRHLRLLSPSKVPNEAKFIVGLTKILFHVKRIAFERECYSNARLFEQSSSIRTPSCVVEIKKAAHWPPV